MVKKAMKPHNETQALPFSQSSAFYSPVTYGFDLFGWIKDAAVKVDKTFIGGFKKFGEGVAEGDFKKIFTGIGEAAAPGLATGINELAEKSPEEQKSTLEIISKKFIDVANKAGEIVRGEANTIREGLNENNVKKMLVGLENLENTHGEIVVKDFISSSKEEFKPLIQMLSHNIRTEGEKRDIEKAIQKEDAQELLKVIESFRDPFMFEITFGATRKIFLTMVEKLNEFSDKLISTASKLSEDIKKEDNLDKIIKDMNELKQIDPEDVKYSIENDQHSSVLEGADIDLYSEFIFF